MVIDGYVFDFLKALKKRCAKLITELAHLGFLTVIINKQRLSISKTSAHILYLPNTSQTCPFNHTIRQYTKEENDSGDGDNHDTARTQTPLL